MRPRLRPLPNDLSTHRRSWATPAEVGDRVGLPAGTIRKWCRQGVIVAKKRTVTANPKSGDWIIPLTSVQLLERRLGLDVKRSA
jgi:hypothetical protein